MESLADTAAGHSGAPLRPCDSLLSRMRVFFARFACAFFSHFIQLDKEAVIPLPRQRRQERTIGLRVNLVSRERFTPYQSPSISVSVSLCERLFDNSFPVITHSKAVSQGPAADPVSLPLSPSRRVHVPLRWMSVCPFPLKKPIPPLTRPPLASGLQITGEIFH